VEEKNMNSFRENHSQKISILNFQKNAKTVAYATELSTKEKRLIFSDLRARGDTPNKNLVYLENGFSVGDISVSLILSRKNKT